MLGLNKELKWPGVFKEVAHFQRNCKMKSGKRAVPVPAVERATLAKS